jgi:hypothetical protein
MIPSVSSGPPARAPPGIHAGTESAAASHPSLKGYNRRKKKIAFILKIWYINFLVFFKTRSGFIR